VPALPRDTAGGGVEGKGTPALRIGGEEVAAPPPQRQPALLLNRHHGSDGCLGMALVHQGAAGLVHADGARGLGAAEHGAHPAHLVHRAVHRQGGDLVHAASGGVPEPRLTAAQSEDCQ